MKNRFPRLHKYLAARFTPGEEFGLHLTVGIAVMLAFAWLFGEIADDVFEGDDITVLDMQLAGWFHQHARSAWTPVMMFITDWHHPLGVGVMTLLFSLYLYRQKARYWLAAVLLSVAGGMLVNVLLKYTFQRARPSFEEPLVTLATYSFPSGHTAGATVFYGVLACYLVCVVPRMVPRALIVCAAGFMIALVALTRVYLGAHYLSDTLAAVAVGSAWLAVCITAMSTLRRRRAARANQ